MFLPHVIGDKAFSIITLNRSRSTPFLGSSEIFVVNEKLSTMMFVNLLLLLLFVISYLLQLKVINTNVYQFVIFQCKTTQI